MEEVKGRDFAIGQARLARTHTLSALNDVVEASRVKVSTKDAPSSSPEMRPFTAMNLESIHPRRRAPVKVTVMPPVYR